MLTYEYHARDSLGNVHDGSVEAESIEEARTQLDVDGFHILSIDEEQGGFQLFPQRISKKEIIYLTSQLSVMVDTGISLSVALNGIESQEKNDSLKSLLNELKRDVESGEDFSTALAKHPKHFNHTFLSLVKAGESTGKLGTMLEKISGYLHKEMEIKGKIRAALAYPAVMIGLACAVTIFLLTFILPKFTPLFNRKGIKLPTPTIVMMTMSDILLGYWYFWLAGIVAALIAFLVFRRTTTGRKVIDTAKINIPIIGPLVRKVTISRSLSTLGTLLESDVPVLRALELTATVANNYHYEQLWRNVIDSVTAGNEIHATLAKSDLFPSTLVQMISAGEQTGNLDGVLKKISAYYEDEVDLSIKTTTSLIEPIMITVMGFVVGGIALALLMPIFSLSRSV
ncbi:MAG: pilus assembly protein PilC [Blastopirellula sp.]|nr:MAG: pilus assembly protein PilC [Blastopirellula sp.]